MKTLHLSIFTILMTFLVAAVSFSPQDAHAQSVTVYTDKPSYSYGDNYTISGKVNPVVPNHVISIVILSPNYPHPASVSLVPNSDGSYLYTLPLKFNDVLAGNFTVIAQYAGAKNQTTFSYIGLPCNQLNNPGNIYSAPIIRGPASNPRIIDSFGNAITGPVKVGQQIQITYDLANGLNCAQPFAYLVQIQDLNGITVSLSWITGTLLAGQSLNPAQSWTPQYNGTYTAQIFTWQRLDNPNALAPPVSVTFDVVPKSNLIQSSQVVPLVVSSTRAGFIPLNITVGNGPEGIGVNPVTKMVYIANDDNSSVSVINATTNSIVATIKVGTNPQGVGVNPKTNMIYVTTNGESDQEDGNVSVINGSNNNVIANVSLATEPFDVAVNPLTNMIYVTTSGVNASLAVINGSSYHLVAKIPFNAMEIEMVDVNPLNNLVYMTYSFYHFYSVSNQTSRGLVAIINGSSNDIIDNIQVGSAPYGIGINPKTNMIYVANSGDNTISVINGITRTIVKTIPVGSTPVGLRVDTQKDMVFVANPGKNTVSVINGTTNSLTSTISGFRNPRLLGVNPTASTIYVDNSDSNFITKLTYVKDCIGECEKASTLSYNEIIALPPLQQFESGIDPFKTQCKNGLVLVIAADDGSPACVKTDTAFRLSALEWGYPPSPFITKTDLLNSTISGGKIKEFQYDPQSASIIIKIQTVSDGSLMVTIPKIITDLNPSHKPFKDFHTVLVDGMEENIDLIPTANGSSFTIPFTNGTQEIEIIGNQVGQQN